MIERSCLAGKQWVRSGTGTIEVRNPATDGEVIATVPAFSEQDCEAALATAKEVFPIWAGRTVAHRADVLRVAADRLERRAGQVVHNLVAENGKPLREARGEVAKSVTTFRYYAGLAGALDGRSFSGGRERLRHETRLEPIGPVVAITSWNVPAAGPARKLAPALLAGNPVILKPASATPLSSIDLVECLMEAGTEPGAIQLLCGPGDVVGQELATHVDTAAVSFTGSTEVGLHLKVHLGRSLARLQLELGGKNAAVVFPDADLSSAARHITEGAFASAGQQCTATSRVLVHHDIAQPLLDCLEQQVRSLVIGDPADEKTTFGPLIDERQVKQVSGFVERAVKDGAQLVMGGHRVQRPGCFYEPTLLAGFNPNAEVWCEEVFGPVLSVLEFGSPDEAICLLNGTKYGLSCAVHTQTMSLARSIVDGADCGVAVVNGPTAGIELPAPFGGFKMSGTESKEHGPESMRFYTRTKLVSWGW